VRRSKYKTIDECGLVVRDVMANGLNGYHGTGTWDAEKPSLSSALIRSVVGWWERRQPMECARERVKQSGMVATAPSSSSSMSDSYMRRSFGSVKTDDRLTSSMSPRNRRK